MGLLIKGSPIPQNCHQCDSWGLSDVVTIDCPVDKNGSLYSFTGRPKGCPLDHVPEHGDLIDRDSTIEKIRHLSDEIDKKLGYEKSAPYITMALYLSNADDFPTIIPAEEGERDERI